MQLSWKKYKILKLLDCFYKLKNGSQHEDGFSERQAHSQLKTSYIQMATQRQI